MRRRTLGIIVFIILSIISSSVFAQSPQISSGLTWLYSAQTSTGYWPQVDTAEYYSTTQALNAVYQFDPTNPAYSLGLNWLAGEVVSPTDYLSRRIIGLKRTGGDVTAEVEGLILYRNVDGGWGGELTYLSTHFDTALALQALKAANYSGSSILSQAINFLTSKQNSDGGWGFHPTHGALLADPSNAYVTATVLRTLSQYNSTFNMENSISKAKVYLLTKQNTDGGFGSSPSTIYETALSFIALSGLITDNTVLSNAVNFLTTTQFSNGSWNDDPYSTALALQALYLAENRPPVPPPPPTTGTVNGTVVDADTNQPLSGVSVSLDSNSSVASMSNETGEFSLADIPAGVHQIEFATRGYATSTAVVTVTAGSFANLGIIPMSVIPTAGIIQGTVTDAATGDPLSEATVIVEGSMTLTAVTAADGSYKITGIAPGAFTVSVNKSGYLTVSATGQVIAGGTLIFSPSLWVEPPQVTTGNLQGAVIDSETGLGLQDVTISIVGSNNFAVTTDNSGYFLFSSIDVGSYSITISKAGYGTQTGTVSIVADTTTNLGSISLVLNPTSGTVQGVITDLSSGSPISGAVITVSGTITSSAITSQDGSYTLSGIAPGDISLLASKAGYYSSSSSGTIAAGEISIFNAALSPIPVSGELRGTVISGSTKIPISDAVVSIVTGTNTATVSTDTTGSFSFNSLTPGDYEATIEASSYSTQYYTVAIVAGTVMNMGKVSLTPLLTSTTVTGKVTDANTGSPISGADIMIVGTDISTKTDSTGSYSLSGVVQIEMYIRASFTGYDTTIMSLNTSQYGVYTVDFSISRSQTGDLGIKSAETDKTTYAAYEPVIIGVEVENTGVDIKTGYVRVLITDDVGNTMDMRNAVWVDNGTSYNQFNFLPGEVSALSTEWSTSFHSPGIYNIIIQITTEEYGTIIAERKTNFVIAPTQAIGNVTVYTQPAYTNLDATEEIKVQATFTNLSNVNTAVSISYDLLNPSGSIVHSGTGTVTLLPNEETKSIRLETFSYTFSEGSGSYPLQVGVLSGPEPGNITGKPVSVAPGIRIDPSQSLTPETVVPDGDKRISVNIHLKGVELK